MTERTRSATDDTGDDFDPAMAADLELIIDALNGHLNPERVAEVTRRLEEDPAFRDFAAPMLLTWSVPSYLERHPRPVGELENAWNEFAERAGIAQPPVPKGWRRHPLWKRIRPLILLLVLLPLVPYVTLALASVVPMRFWAWIGQSQEQVIASANADHFGPISRVGHDTAWIPIGGTGLHVRPALGSDLRVAERRKNGKRQLWLDSGTVRFHVAPITRADPAVSGHQIDVHTPAGVLSAGESEFTVRVRGDTTDVEVNASGRPGSLFRPVTARLTIVRGPALSTETKSYNIPLAAGERTRLVRGQVPARFADNP